MPAVSYASSHANVVSMSWGGGEFSREAQYDGYFNRPGVAFVASSGDDGAPISWPAASPNVLSVGGTVLSLGDGGAYGGESGWSGSGGGPSAYLARPAYQQGVVTQTGGRANPDVTYDASPSTGFAVYDSYPSNETNRGWLQIGGTSAGAPQWAALLAIADQGRALDGQPALEQRRLAGADDDPLSRRHLRDLPRRHRRFQHRQPELRRRRRLRLRDRPRHAAGRPRRRRPRRHGGPGEAGLPGDRRARVGDGR